jgi:hypothetical protein
MPLTLIDATRRLLDEVLPKRLFSFLADWPAAPIARPIAAARLPVLRWLPETPRQTVPPTTPLVNLLVSRADQLAWRQTYTEPDVSSEFLQRYGWSELIGLRGPVASERLAAGFLLLGPHTEYPRHRHAAAEIYLPLAGTALWQRGDAAWRRRAPGRPIHHPPWMPHAMRTEVQPLLALYLWRGGDLAQRSRFD